jgi:hypothetical protein
MSSKKVAFEARMRDAAMLKILDTQVNWCRWALPHLWKVQKLRMTSQEQ